MKQGDEQGRSMIEMLAVLAIIGVLSIAGITGYSMAMNRYRAEQIFNAATAMTATTVGGGVSSHEEIVNGVKLTLDSSGAVCVSWNGMPDEVQEIFNKRTAPYEQTGNCVNFKKRKSLTDLPSTN